jgi:hypothetical protein
MAAVCVTPAGKVPEMATEVCTDTGVVVIMKVALDWPAGTVTLAGTVAAPLELARETTKPPVEAVVFKETVPVATPPPSRTDGETETCVRLGDRLTFRIAVWLSP